MIKFKSPPTSIIIHCSASNVISDYESIKNLHVNYKGWDDIGYHFVINMMGKIEVGRDLQFIGAHCKGHNSNSIGICLGGNTHEDFTRKQFENLALCVKQLKSNYPIKELFGHYEIDMHGKTCPNIPAELLRLWLGF